MPSSEQVPLLPSQEKQKEEEEGHFREALQVLLRTNEVLIDDKKYPFLTAKDVFQKDEKSCILCLLHNDHTPCGSEIKVYKECILQNPSNNDNADDNNNNRESEVCFPVFQKFYDCFAKNMKLSNGSYYYMMRGKLILDHGGKDMMKAWLKAQKYAAFRQILKE